MPKLKKDKSWPEGRLIKLRIIDEIVFHVVFLVSRALEKVCVVCYNNVSLFTYTVVTRESTYYNYMYELKQMFGDRKRNKNHNHNTSCNVPEKRPITILNKISMDFQDLKV